MPLAGFVYFQMKLSNRYIFLGDCKVMHDGFLRPHDLKFHKDHVHFGKKRSKYQCVHCLERFFTVAEIQEHLKKLHDGKANWPCELCGESSICFRIFSHVFRLLRRKVIKLGKN